MARIARVVAPGIPHHITQRGNRRMKTFFCEADYREYLHLMAQWCNRCKVLIWSYCLMPNHVHLIAVPETEEGLRKAIGEAHRRYTRSINFQKGWKYENFSLVAGHTWSTLMDLKIIPEGLTEPTVSGVIFMRQPQVRVSQAFESGLALHAALEDPNSDDVFDSSSNQEKNITNIPDLVAGVEYGKKDVGHLRLNGILRDIEVRMPQGGKETNHAWGLALSGHLKLLERDVWRFNGVYGKGLGRYLLGIQSAAGSAIDANDNDFELRDNWGVMTAYEHHWNDSFRSSALAGYARSKPLGWQPGDTFESSIYASANLMWEVLPYLTFGVEYAYGQRENKDDSDLDNHRLSLGLQFC